MQHKEPASSSNADQMVLVLTSVPDQDTADTLAHTLITKKLAACVHIGAAGHSVYRWQEQLETTVELPLTIKTSAACYDEVRSSIRAHHPYELPEILCVPVASAEPAYLAWVLAQTGQTILPT